jgi:peptide/nickel transport system substrate-binding protein
MAGQRYNVILGARSSRRTVLRGGVAGLAGLSAFALACGSSNNNKNNGNKAANTAANNAAAPSAAASVAATKAGSPAAGSPAAGAPAGGSPAAGSTAKYVPVAGKPGGNYQPGFTGPFAGVDPHNSVYGGSGIVPIVYNYLVRTSLLAPDQGVIQELSLSQESAPDNLSMTFKLRPDAMIQQNSLGVPVRPIDATDAKMTFDRIADPKAAANGFTWVHPWVDKTEAIDATTFKITTKSPYAWLINGVGNNLQSAIVPREWLASPNIKANAVGTGPFMLQSLQEGAQAVMVKNPAYWEKGRPYLDQLTIKAFADQTTYRTAFSSNQLDAYTATNIEEAQQLQKAGKNIELYTDPSFGFDSFWMNTKIKPWDDPRIRTAVRMAINPEEYIQLIAHGQGKQIGPVTYSMGKYALSDDDLKKLMPFDIKQAKQMLQAAGQPNLTFPFAHPTSSNVPDYVNIFVRQLQAAGITAQAQPMDAGTWVAQYFASKLSASLSLNQEYATPEFAMNWFKTGGITGGGQYDTGFSDPDVDAALTKAAGIFDENARAQAYQDAQKLVISKGLPFWNFFGGYTNINVDSYVMNYPRGIGSLGYYFDKEIWLNK